MVGENSLLEARHGGVNIRNIIGAAFLHLRLNLAVLLGVTLLFWIVDVLTGALMMGGIALYLDPNSPTPDLLDRTIWNWGLEFRTHTVLALATVVQVSLIYNLITVQKPVLSKVLQKPFASFWTLLVLFALFTILSTMLFEGAIFLENSFSEVDGFLVPAAILAVFIASPFLSLAPVLVVIKNAGWRAPYQSVEMIKPVWFRWCLVFLAYLLAVLSLFYLSEVFPLPSQTFAVPGDGANQTMLGFIFVQFAINFLIWALDLFLLIVGVFLFLRLDELDEGLSPTDLADVFE